MYIFQPKILYIYIFRHRGAGSGPSGDEGITNTFIIFFGILKFLII